MTTINMTRVSLPFNEENRGVAIHQWVSLANGDDGEPLDLSAFADRSVQVTGTFGASGNLRVEGSLDGVTYSVLSDPQGNALDIASAKIEAVLEATRFIRPRVTSGDGTTDLSVTIISRS